MSPLASYDNVANIVRGYQNGLSADDVDPCFNIFYDGEESTATVSVHSVVANTMRLIYGATTTDFLLTNAAYDTFGELQDAVNALPGWTMKRVAARRADSTYSSTLKIVAFGATSALLTGGRTGGVTAYFDSSTWGNRAMAVGVEQIATGLDGDTIPMPARTSMNTIPYVSDPTYDNYPPDGSQVYSVGYGALLSGASFVGAHSGTTTWTITPCTDQLDGAPFIYTDTAATTGVMSNLGSDQIGTGIQNNAGWLIVTVSAGGVISSSTLACNGAILYAGGI